MKPHPNHALPLKHSASAYVLAMLTMLPFSSTRAAGPNQDPLLIQQAVQQFAEEQSAGLQGEVSVQVGRPDARLNLAACDKLQAFLPKGGRLLGKTNVGVRCLAPSPWTLYLQVQVQVFGDTIITARPINAGQTISADQLSKVRGELSSLPSGTATDMAQLIGQTTQNALPAGVAIRLDGLRKAQIIQPGQVVRLRSSGPGFQVSTEGRAIGAGSDGQIVQVKMPNGQQISGIAKAGGIVEVSN
jgi:flagellar basal body P-ring formation protein FlgA